MRLRNKSTPPEKIELQMTPMIDMVFQLLAFFIMTFRISANEADFPIEMPSAAKAPGIPDPKQQQPKRLNLIAKPTGELEAITLDNIAFGTDFRRLGQHIHNTFGDNTGPSGLAKDTVLEITCSPNLHYHNVIQAIDAVSGVKVGERVSPLIQNFKFTPPPPDRKTGK